MGVSVPPALPRDGSFLYDTDTHAFYFSFEIMWIAERPAQGPARPNRIIFMTNDLA